MPLVDKFEPTFIFRLLVQEQLFLPAQDMSRGGNNPTRLWASCWVAVIACSHSARQKLIFHHLSEAITASSTPYYANSCCPVWIFLVFFHTLISSFLNSWCQRSPCSLCYVRWVSEGGNENFTVAAVHTIPEKLYIIGILPCNIFTP